MLLELLINTLGQPKNKPYNGQINYEFNCPTCADENFGTPDNKYNLGILINGNEQKFHCWKCGFKGHVRFLLQRYGTYDDIKKYDSLHLDSFIANNNLYKNDSPKNVYLPQEFISFNNLDTKNPDHQKALNYLKERKINKKLINFFKLGFCLSGKYKNRIIIPTYDKNDKLTYFIGRSFDGTKPTYYAPFINKEELIFNESNINWNHTIYLVEGVFDMFSLPVNTIPLTGKMLSKRLIENIIKYRPNVVIILDEDATKDALKLLYKIDLLCLDNIKVKVIRMKNKDLNNMLTNEENVKDILFLNE